MACTLKFQAPFTPNSVPIWRGNGISKYTLLVGHDFLSNLGKQFESSFKLDELAQYCITDVRFVHRLQPFIRLPENPLPQSYALHLPVVLLTCVPYAFTPATFYILTVRSSFHFSAVFLLLKAAGSGPITLSH